MDTSDKFGLSQDIYRMRREKSRSGCLLMVVVLGAAALAAALAAGWWWWNKADDGVEPAAPLELPEAPVEGDLPAEPVPEAAPAEPVPVPVLSNSLRGYPEGTLRPEYASLKLVWVSL